MNLAELDRKEREATEERQRWAKERSNSKPLMEAVAALEEAASDNLRPLLDLIEQLRLALGHAAHMTEHNKANCARCREARKWIDAALAAWEQAKGGSE